MHSFLRAGCFYLLANAVLVFPSSALAQQHHLANAVT
jgi:hypothetical protein